MGQVLRDLAGIICNKYIREDAQDQIALMNGFEKLMDSE